MRCVYTLLCCVGLASLPCAAAQKHGITGPAAVSVMPNNGSGLSRTFTALYSDTNGAADLQVVYLDIGVSGVGEAHSCFVAYVPYTGLFYLFNDTNSSTSTVMAGANASQSNSQCTLSGVGASAMTSGNNLTVTFPIMFNSGYTGMKNIYGLAQTYSGASSGSVLLGTYTPSEPTLAAVSVMPINTSGFFPITFSALYTDSKGASDIQVAYLIFTTATPPTSLSCFVAYVPSGNQLYLYNDADTGLATGSPITAGTASTVSNSACTLSGSGGTATLLGNNFTAPFNLTFKNDRAICSIVYNVYGLAESYDGTRSPLTLLGTWTANVCGIG